MVVECIRYSIDSERAEALEHAYRRAAAAFDTSEHCERSEISRCSEDLTQYVVRIEWNSEEGQLAPWSVSSPVTMSAVACCLCRTAHLRATASTRRQRSNESGSPERYNILGSPIDEAIDALHSRDIGTATCESELWRMQAIIDRIDTKIAELQATRRDVSETMDACQHRRCRFSSLAPLRPTAQRH